MWKHACRAAEVPAKGLKEVAVEGGPSVVIANAGTEFFACQAACPHTDVPLADGIHDGKVLTCLEHMWQFDVKTGAPMGDAQEGLTGFPLKEEHGDIYVSTP